MFTIDMYMVSFLVSFLVAVISTPFIKTLAIKIGATDQPNHRKVHHRAMPRLGGLAIVIGFIVGGMISSIIINIYQLAPFFLGVAIIVIIGILDDKYTLSAAFKLVGQILAASVVVFSGLKIDMITIPFYGEFFFGIWSYPFTILWIVGITNAINLIDGLDGLAAGVSSIALLSILTMAILDGQIIVIALSVILIGSTLGFLIFNFYPAQLFMGDTGSLFLGYSISVISIMGLLKNLTLISLIVPIMILAIPIFDTIFAIIRRIVKKQKITAPDKYHLHYCLLAMGFSHRQTVLIIYGVSVIFGILAIIFSATTLWVSIALGVALLIGIQVTAELIGIIGHRKKPILDLLKRLKVVGK